MKKITAIIFGLSLSLAGLSLAAQTPQPPAKDAGSNAAPAAKKHVKKAKKNKNASEPATSTTPSAAATGSSAATPKK